MSKSKNTAVRKQKLCILHEYANAIERECTADGCMLHTVQGEEGASLRRMTGDVMEARR